MTTLENRDFKQRMIGVLGGIGLTLALELLVILIILLISEMR